MTVLTYFSQELAQINNNSFNTPKKSLVKPYEKLYILDGKLTVDKRKFYFRYFSEDNRNKTLEYLLKSKENLLYTVNELMSSTYKDDTIWISKAKKIIIENDWACSDTTKINVPNYTQTWASTVDILTDFSILAETS